VPFEHSTFIINRCVFVLFSFVRKGLTPLPYIECSFHGPSSSARRGFFSFLLVLRPPLPSDCLDVRAPVSDPLDESLRFFTKKSADLIAASRSTNPIGPASRTMIHCRLRQRDSPVTGLYFLGAREFLSACRFFYAGR